MRLIPATHPARVLGPPSPLCDPDHHHSFLYIIVEVPRRCSRLQSLLLQFLRVTARNPEERHYIYQDIVAIIPSSWVRYSPALTSSQGSFSHFLSLLIYDLNLGLEQNRAVLRRKAVHLGQADAVHPFLSDSHHLHRSSLPPLSLARQ